MTSATQQSDQMLALVRSKTPADRERLLSAIVQLCDGAAASKEPAVQALINDIFMGIVMEAEADIRRRLADRLAGAEWAPPALINVLALDDIEIARPIIALSPVLQDSDLVRLLVEATLEHQIEVARRPAIGAPVVNAILDQSDPDVLAALAANDTADISVLAMNRMVSASKRVAAMRAPLARHPRLTSDLALNLYGWVGETLRGALASRFQLQPSVLEQAVAEAVRDAHEGEGQPGVARQNDRERDMMEQRLIAKLDAAGQLRPGYLLRALRENKMSMFEQALATLSGFGVKQVQAAIASGRPELLALACVTIGIDRSVFPTLLALVQKLSPPPGGSIPTLKGVGQAFGMSPEAAAAAFRKEVSAI